MAWEERVRFWNMRAWSALLMAALLMIPAPMTARADSLKAGLLKFGTVEWLTDVIKFHQLDKKAGYDLETLMLASNNATQVALMGKEAELIVTDWFWVLRQRKAGGDFLFVPYSTAVGALMVPGNSPAKTVADLKGKRIGIAGGPLDKSWLLLRAVGMKTPAGDLSSTASPVYGAPPLLNQQALYNEVDGLLNFWHFAAALEAKGFRRLVTVSDMMTSVGLKGPIPLIGFVFPEKVAKAKPNVIAGFLRSVKEAQDIMAKSDAEWDRLRPLMRAASDEEFRLLRDRYREGMTFAWGPEQHADAKKLFEILAGLGGEELTGKDVVFDAAMFWQGPSN
jgi:NitT/TauT family transport system substrate-binding protein